MSASSLETSPVRFAPDELAGAGYLYLRYGVKRGEADMRVEQAKQQRSLEYDSEGRLLGIDFLNLECVDLTDLPSDDVIPPDGNLVSLFNAFGVAPDIEVDLGE